MIRADVCASDDAAGVARLQAVLAELGVVADDTWHDGPLGTGLHRYRRGNNELTVFADAWVVDIHGPIELIHDILARLGQPPESAP